MSFHRTVAAVHSSNRYPRENTDFEVTTTDTMHSIVVQDALRLGLPAFPCRADKRPATPHGFKDATSDPDGIRKLWRDYPGPLVGVPTGDVSGPFVLDVDSAKHPEAADWLERHAQYLPDTRKHQTKSGGFHFLFQHAHGLGNSTSKLAKGIDTRGDGGYIIWWPFALGSWAAHYFGPIVELPGWLITELRPPPRRFESPHPQFDQPIGDPRAKVQGIYNAVAQTREGNRNGIVFWASCRIRDMIANGELTQSEGSGALQALHKLSQHIGLPARESFRTIDSAFRVRP